MSSDEQIPVVADVENAKISDGTSTAGEHTVDKVNDDEQVPQTDEKSTSEKQDEETNGEIHATATGTEENDDDAKINNNKRDIDDVDKDDDDDVSGGSGGDGEKKNGQTEEDDEEAVVSTTTTTTISNKKVKIMDPLVNENGGETDETSSTSAKVPNEELTIV